MTPVSSDWIPVKETDSKPNSTTSGFGFDPVKESEEFLEQTSTDKSLREGNEPTQLKETGPNNLREREVRDKEEVERGSKEDGESGLTKKQSFRRLKQQEETIEMR